MIQHTLTLQGPDCAGGKPHPGTVGPVLNMLGPMLRDNLRQAFFTSSRIKGRPNKTLARAWDIRFLGMKAHDADATILHFEMATIGKAAPELYEQMELWDDAPGAEDTGFDLLGYTLTDISEGRLESNRFDLPLLRKIEPLKKVFARGVDRISFGGHRLSSGRGVPPIERPFVERVGELANTTPAPRRVRVQGKLDMVRCSDRAFELMLNNGARLRAVWVPEDLAPMARYLNQEVLIEGDAMFRPSGNVLRLDAEAIRPSESDDQFFSEMPTPARNAAIPVRAQRTNGARATGFEAIAGAWPGKESIEDLLDTLAELGR